MMRRVSRDSIRGRLGRSLAMVTVAVVAVTTLGACVPGGETASSPKTELRLYTGEIPEPAELMASTPLVLPEVPAPPTDFSDEAAMAEYEKAVEEYMAAMEDMDLESASGDAIEFAKQVGELVEATRTSDEDAVAAWQSLLVASGIAVGYGDAAVEMNGMRGSGIPMTSGELRLHTLLGASPMMMPLTEVAGIMAATTGVEGVDVTQELYDDLMDMSASDFGTVFILMNPETFGTMQRGQYRTTPVHEVMLTGGQLSLVLRRLSADLLHLAEQNDMLGQQSTATPRATSTLEIELASSVAADRNVCGADVPPWMLESRKSFAKGNSVGFGKVLERLLDLYEVTDSTRLAGAAAAGFLALASMVVKMSMLQAQFSIDNAPLVRTKYRTPGERRDLTTRFEYPQEAMADVINCASALLAPYGIDLADTVIGPASGIDVDLNIKSDRLEFGQGSTGTDTYLKQTDNNGVAVFPIQGAGQRERIPEGAEPDEVAAQVRTDVNIEGSDFIKDLMGAAWDVVAPGVAGILGNVASRMKLISFSWDVPVRDWELKAEFDMVMSGTLWAHSGTSRGGVAQDPCGVWLVNRSTTASGTVESSKPHRVLVEYLTGDILDSPTGAVFMRSLGMDESQMPIVDDAMQVAHFGADYALTKSESSPGQDPMPPHYEEPGVGGCGDGNGSGYTPQPDCGARDLTGVVSINVSGGVYFLTAESPLGQAWNDCGGRTFPSDPLAPPVQIRDCANADMGGGEMPSLDAIFNPRGWFEISGTLDCSRDGEGTLQRYTFEWTMKFCRVVDGKSEGCET